MSKGPLSDAERWLAAEHALGLTEGARRGEAERRMADDPAFRTAVEDWLAQLEGLLDEVQPVRPPDRVWRAVERTVAQAPEAAPARRAPGRALGLLALGAALGAGLTALVLLAPPGWRPGADAPPGLVATLAPAEEGPLAVAEVELGEDTLTIRLSLLEEAERVPQLWWIPEGGAPRPLGLLQGEADRALRVPLSEIGADRPAAGDALAVSLEPPGGSRTGAPTGPVVAQGTLEAR